ncbi:MAG: hypothetical protein ACRDYU_03725 [Actinomycetes bacterium]
MSLLPGEDKAPLRCPTCGGGTVDHCPPAVSVHRVQGSCVWRKCDLCRLAIAPGLWPSHGGLGPIRTMHLDQPAAHDPTDGA